VLQLYPANDDAEANVAVNNLTRDLSFGMQNFAWALIRSERGKAKAYLYFFKRKVPIFKGAVNYGAFPGEVPYA
jgi:para-nitrobenzyl esterase